LALDGSNWQLVDLFDFQKDVTVIVVENIAKCCKEFLKAIRLENCRSISDDAIQLLSFYLNFENKFLLNYFLSFYLYFFIVFIKETVFNLQKHRNIKRKAVR
jgi:hypothetical protein